MPTAFEAEIQSLFRDLKDPRSVADDLVRRWNLNLLSEDEKIDCAQFMLASGQFAMLFNQLVRATEQKSILPWAQFAEAVGVVKIKPTVTEIDALLTGANEQKSSNVLVRSHKLDLWSRKFGELRASIDEQKKRQREDLRVELKERLDFLRVQRLESEEEKVLDEMSALFPEEKEARKERVAFELRRAKGVVSARTDRDRDWETYLARDAERLSPEQTAARDLMTERAFEIVKEKPRVAYDLAVNLHFMGFFEAALEILQKMPEPTAAADWFRLELLLDARRFVDVLVESVNLENAYADDPESSFAAAYARARALKGLGQLHEAIDLVRNLVAIRPQYKSAQSLLMDWSGGDE